MYQWARRNPPLATIMVISGHGELESLASTFSGLKNKGYRILLTYHQRDPVLASLPKHCFWETLLSGVLSLNNHQFFFFFYLSLITTPKLFLNYFKTFFFADADNNLETTTRLVFPYRLDHGTGEFPWSCSVCHYDAPSFEDFTKHLKCETHAYFVSTSLSLFAAFIKYIFHCLYILPLWLSSRSGTGMLVRTTWIVLTLLTCSLVAHRYICLEQLYLI